ncbi:dipeptide epimerase [Halorientalis brevis]|uniref:Dipeptide epimerase n=1 Tax=Halorientalis brevis TaxID=1126241 RepID=A0ABD6C810_9EURY|nr:dipeptide epimerase [Halorientalis brevis]
MTLTTDFTWHDLPLDVPFGISRGTTERSGNVVVRVTDEDGTVGIGGGAPVEYYGESRESVESVLPDLLSVVEDVDDPFQLQRIERRLRDVVGDATSDPAARSAVSVALHDLVCKRLDVPLYRYWGLDPDRPVTSSFTIGLADTEAMADRAAETVDAGYSVLKVKLGTDRDREVVRAVRAAAPEATVRVDANEAWDPDEAVAMTEFLADHGVEFVEQPVPAADPEGLARVREEGALPVAADESCVTARDVPAVADSVDVVVVKLAKCGGLQAARRQIHTAHAHDLDVMLGCMTESNASIAAAAHLTPLVEYADLDGALLLADDPFDGVPMPGGRIDLTASVGPGTGVSER